MTQTLAGPEAVGSWSGIQNAIGNLGGIVSPAATGFIIHWTATYTLAFALSAAVLLTGIVFYARVGPIEPLQWEKRTELPATLEP